MIAHARSARIALHQVALRAIACCAVFALTAAGAHAASTTPLSAQGRHPMTASTTRNPWPIVELRQYQLHPGQRDVLIDLFERQFIESQEATGMEVLAHTRDLDATDHFVWFRGFHDMPSRAEALHAFYDGPIWKAHREAANATIVDNDNVLLLHEARPGSGFVLPATRAPIGATTSAGLLIATIYSFATPVDETFLDFFATQLTPTVRATGARVLASYVTEHSTNNFPRLPVREGENVFVWVAAFKTQSDYAAYLAALDRSKEWRGVQTTLSRQLRAPAEVHRLEPAARSLVRG